MNTLSNALPIPGWRPRLVVLDLDGTAVPVGTGTDPGRPTPAVRAAVERVLAAGVPVVVATGRSVCNSLENVTQLGLAGIRLVCSNGAVGYDLGSGRITHRATFDPGPAARVLAAALPGAGFAVETELDGFQTTAGFIRDFPSRFLGQLPLAELVATPTSRLVCRADHHPPASFAAATTALAGTGTSWVFGRPNWLDLGPAGISKATGVATVAADLGIAAADVLAIGDGGNDLELFGWAGCAIAMGQAPEPVRRAATLVTDPVERDGVATALHRWFPAPAGDPR